MGPELQVLLRLQVLAQTWGVSWGSTCCLQSLGECGDGVGPGMHFEADLPWTTRRERSRGRSQTVVSQQRRPGGSGGPVRNTRERPLCGCRDCVGGLEGGVGAPSQRVGAGCRGQRRREVRTGRGWGGVGSVGCPGGKQQCAACSWGLDAPIPFLIPRRRTKKRWWASQRGPSLAPASTGWARGEPQGPGMQEPGGGPGSWLWPARWRRKEAPSQPARCSLRASPCAQAWAVFQRQLENPGSAPQTRSSFRKTDHLLLPLISHLAAVPMSPAGPPPRPGRWVGGRAGFVAGFRGGGTRWPPPRPGLGSPWGVEVPARGEPGDHPLSLLGAPGCGRGLAVWVRHLSGSRSRC